MKLFEHYLNQESPFTKEWKKIDKPETHPQRARSVIRMPFSEIKENVVKQDKDFANYIVKALYAGDVLLMQGCYTPKFIKKMKDDCFEWGKQRKPVFHKMLEGVPDFHRIIDEETGKKYSIHHVRHTYYFFPWNDDPIGIIPEVYDKWRVIKGIGGFHLKEYEKNTPKDGVVDRFIVARYPKGSGRIEPHSDPYMYQRSIMGTKVSERGKEYEQGGIFYVDGKGKEVDVEGIMELGDMYLSFPTVLHGVNPVDPHVKLDWNDPDGRWFLGLYSNASDIHQNRHTGYGVDSKEYLEKEMTNSGNSLVAPTEERIGE